MLKIIEEHALGVFDQKAIAVLIAAFNKAWQLFLRSGAKFGSDREMTRAREKLAHRIILLGRAGERDKRRLCDDALLHLRD